MIGKDPAAFRCYHFEEIGSIMFSHPPVSCPPVKAPEKIRNGRRAAVKYGLRPDLGKFPGGMVFRFLPPSIHELRDSATSAVAGVGMGHRIVDDPVRTRYRLTQDPLFLRREIQQDLIERRLCSLIHMITPFPDRKIIAENRSRLNSIDNFFPQGKKNMIVSNQQ